MPQPLGTMEWVGFQYYFLFPHFQLVFWEDWYTSAGTHAVTRAQTCLSSSFSNIQLFAFHPMSQEGTRSPHSPGTCPGISHWLYQHNRTRGCQSGINLLKWRPSPITPDAIQATLYSYTDFTETENWWHPYSSLKSQYTSPHADQQFQSSKKKNQIIFSH